MNDSEFDEINIMSVHLIHGEMWINVDLHLWSMVENVYKKHVSVDRFVW